MRFKFYRHKIYNIPLIYVGTSKLLVLLSCREVDTASKSKHCATTSPIVNKSSVNNLHMALIPKPLDGRFFLPLLF
jgi:hypothetical protein